MGRINGFFHPFGLNLNELLALEMCFSFAHSRLNVYIYMDNSVSFLIAHVPYAVVDHRLAGMQSR